MQVFATRVWGFSPLTWPVIVFGKEGNRDRLLRDSNPGDRIIFVATQGEEVEVEERGRILGMAEIGRTAVNTLDVVRREDISSRGFDEYGHFRWPRGIPMLRAWHFTDKPLLTEVLSHQLTYDATPRAVLLSAEDAQVILSLKAELVVLPDSAVLQRERKFADALTFARAPTRGPQPSDWEGTVSRSTEGIAYTYVFRFGKRDIWKIGWATDVKARLAQVNEHVPSELLGENWAERFRERRPNQQAAYEMEQRLLELLAKYRTVGERVRCTEKDILAAVSSAFRG